MAPPGPRRPQSPPGVAATGPRGPRRRTPRAGAWAAARGPRQPRPGRRGPQPAPRPPGRPPPGRPATTGCQGSPARGPRPAVGVGPPTRPIELPPGERLSEDTDLTGPGSARPSRRPSARHDQQTGHQHHQHHERRVLEQAAQQKGHAPKVDRPARHLTAARQILQPKMSRCLLRPSANPLVYGGVQPDGGVVTPVAYSGVGAVTGVDGL
jgi:hypothetical protein